MFLSAQVRVIARVPRALAAGTTGARRAGIRIALHSRLATTAGRRIR